MNAQIEQNLFLPIILLKARRGCQEVGSVSESRPPCESCRIYSISEHGDIFAASSQEKRAPRCVAYAKNVTTEESETSVLLGFQIGPLRSFLLTDGFKNGYPTKRKPAMLVDGAQRQCGIAYAVFSQQGRNLVFETCIGVMAPPGSRTAPRGDPIRYIVSCPALQENIATEAGGSTGAEKMCRFGILAYHVSVDSRSGGLRTFTMEQTLECSGPGKGHRSLAIYGAEQKEDIPTALFLARLITLTGYPSNAKPIEISKTEFGRHERRSWESLVRWKTT